METDTALRVGEVARLAGLSVRTLHHYDEIGLVVPQGRTEAGYRLYGTDAVERLQEVLFFRELGFGLDRIKAIVTDPGYDRLAALVDQRDLLEAKAERVLAMVDAVDRAIETERTGMKLSKKEMLEVFGDFDPTEYEEEVRERWGDTAAYRESARRVKDYTKEDWVELGREADEINQAFLALMEAGTPPDSEAAIEVAERHRQHITSWFYDCSIEIHAGLGRMYVEDSRFTDNIDKAGAGLAQYQSDAIAANAGQRAE